MLPWAWVLPWKRVSGALASWDSMPLGALQRDLGQDVVPQIAQLGAAQVEPSSTN